MITEAQMEARLMHLAETDDQYAEAKMNLERADVLKKRTRARIYKTTDGTVAERSAIAETHPDVIAADDDHSNALLAFETLKGARQTDALIIEVWRSLNAARRRGNL